MEEQRKSVEGKGWKKLKGGRVDGEEEERKFTIREERRR